MGKQGPSSRPPCSDCFGFALAQATGPRGVQIDQCVLLLEWAPLARTRQAGAATKPQTVETLSARWTCHYQLMHVICRGWDQIAIRCTTRYVRTRRWPFEKFVRCCLVTQSGVYSSNNGCNEVKRCCLPNGCRSRSRPDSNHRRCSRLDEPTDRRALSMSGRTRINVQFRLVPVELPEQGP